MIVNKEDSNLVRLGDYIEVYDVINFDSKDFPFCGINKDKTFMPTVADTNELDNSKYKIVEKDVFVFSGMQTGRDVCIRLALYDKDETILVSPAYTTFIIKDKSEILPEYLFIQFNRFQMDRYGWFLSDGSIRSNLDWNVFCDIMIPLPELDIQQELVDTYNGLKALAEQNEALIKPLNDACQAYIVDCKKKYKEVELGGYIEECIEKNRDLKFESKDARGVYSNGTFGDTLANLEGSNLTSYKVVKTDEFAYSNRINIGSIAQNNEKDVIVSPSYTVFRVKSEEIIPKYLFILLRRNEFLRSTLFFAIGTIKDDFSYDRMTEVKIPLLPIEVQQTILNLYNCAEEAKKIATEAREKMKTLCPALVQKAIYS
jgi:type I restriction enzyme S subunit